MAIKVFRREREPRVHSLAARKRAPRSRCRRHRRLVELYLEELYMVKRKNKSSEKKQKDSRHPSFLLRGKSKSLSIGEFSLESLNSFKNLEYYETIVKSACSLFVVIAILIQIRFALFSVPPAMVDGLPSYRFYKGRFFKSAWTDIVIIA